MRVRTYLTTIYMQFVFTHALTIWVIVWTTNKDIKLKCSSNKFWFKKYSVYQTMIANGISGFWR